MKKIVSILFVFYSLFAQAVPEIDQKLAGYIQKFQLQNLKKPSMRNRKLFQLGHSLFQEKSLSGNMNISCRDCHHPQAMTIDGLPLGLGEGSMGIQASGEIRRQSKGKILARNTQSLMNLHQIDVLFWDGRVSFDPQSQTFTTPVDLPLEVKKTLKSALAAQALFPMVDHAEMRGQKGSNPLADAPSEAQAWDLIVNRLMKMESYRKAFAEVFPGEKINIGHVGEALAEFQRVNFFLADTAYDRYLQGELSALNEVQKIGMDVFFNKGKCGECHNGAHLSNFEFHNVGGQQIGPGKSHGDDLGRNEFDKSQTPYSFRVPPLRNVAVTAPYMHAGTIKTLPQVVEHYDMIVESIEGFKLINNWKNYIESLMDHDHGTDPLRISSLSEKLSLRLNFTEEEEKALTEFLSSALTDKRLLNREVPGDYKTHFRIQLKPSGYDLLDKKYPVQKTTEVFYYFDVLLEGGFALRELANPIRLIAIKSDSGARLLYREQVYKSAVAENGVVLGVNFNRQEVKDIQGEVLGPLESAYLDMFNRIYTYNNEAGKNPIPALELSIIKSDLEILAESMRSIRFNGSDNISDQMNMSKDAITYVPTSYNTKSISRFELSIEGTKVLVELQDSTLRTEEGKIVKTYAIEMETPRLSKSQVEAFGKKVLGELGLSPSEIGGTSPSPSELTLEVINQVME